MPQLANRLLWGGLVWAAVVVLACAQPQRSNPPSAPTGAGASAPSTTASGQPAPPSGQPATPSPRAGRGAPLDPPVTRTLAIIRRSDKRDEPALTAVHDALLAIQKRRLTLPGIS